MVGPGRLFFLCIYQNAGICKVDTFLQNIFSNIHQNVDLKKSSSEEWFIRKELKYNFRTTFKLLHFYILCFIS